MSCNLDTVKKCANVFEILINGTNYSDLKIDSMQSTKVARKADVPWKIWDPEIS